MNRLTPQDHGVHVHHHHGRTWSLPLVDGDPMPAIDALTHSGAIAGARAITVVGSGTGWDATNGVDASGTLELTVTALGTWAGYLNGRRIRLWTDPLPLVILNRLQSTTN